VHLVGFIIRKFVTMHGNMNVKNFTEKHWKFDYRKYAFSSFTQHTIRQGCTNPWLQIVMVAKFRTVEPNILGPQ
jgi:hypothetical protein